MKRGRMFWAGGHVRLLSNKQGKDTAYEDCNTSSECEF